MPAPSMHAAAVNHAGVPLMQASAAALLSFGGFSDMALANELDVINEPKPTKQHVIDDAGVINKTNRKGLNDELTRLEVRAPEHVGTGRMPMVEGRAAERPQSRYLCI